MNRSFQQQPIADVPPIRILLADSNQMRRDLISSRLKRQPQFRLMGFVGRADEFMELMKKSEVDVALVSDTLEEGPLSGLAALTEIRRLCPNIRTVVLMDKSEVDLVLNSFRSGANGVFSCAESNYDSLCNCVESVQMGRTWAIPKHIDFLIEALGQTPRMRVVDASGTNLLSKREEDVVRQVAEGMSNREISKALDLSEHTVKNNLFRIFDKLGISSRTELVLYALASDRLPRSSFEPMTTNAKSFSRFPESQVSIPVRASVDHNTPERYYPKRLSLIPSK